MTLAAAEHQSAFDRTAFRQATVWQTIADAAAKVPQRAALVGADDAGNVRRLTYAELVARVRDFSAGLAGLGVARGDRVILWMTNRLEWVIASFAAQRLGATVVPVNTFLTAAEIQYLIAQSGARHLVMLDRFRALDMPAMLAGMAPEFAEAEAGALYSVVFPDLRNVIVLRTVSEPQSSAFDFAAVEARGADEPDLQDRAARMAEKVRPSDLSMVKYTSGSTGFPKGVMLEQGGVVANARAHSRRVGAGHSDVFFSMMPFFHGGGSIWGLMTSMVNAGTLVFTEAFNADQAVDLIRGEGATIMFGVLAEEVARNAVARGVDFPTLRTSAVPDANARQAMPNVSYTIVPFGLTEAYGPAAVSSPDDPPETLGKCGLPLDGNEICVVDPETGEALPPDTVGEAWIRGNTMRGYWNKPEETARVLMPGGWLRSEDLVSMDAEGRVTYVGRLKLMLKVGGENVSIEEVERVAASHEAISDCGVAGIPDPRKGEAVGLYAVLQPGASIDETALRAWLAARLARFKQPREIRFVDALPRLGNGKIDRVTLRQLAAEEFPA